MSSLSMSSGFMKAKVFSHEQAVKALKNLLLNPGKLIRKIGCTQISIVNFQIRQRRLVSKLFADLRCTCLQLQLVT